MERNLRFYTVIFEATGAFLIMAIKGFRPDFTDEFRDEFIWRNLFIGLAVWVALYLIVRQFF